MMQNERAAAKELSKMSGRRSADMPKELAVRHAEEGDVAAVTQLVNAAWY